MKFSLKIPAQPRWDKVIIDRGEQPDRADSDCISIQCQGTHPLDTVHEIRHGETVSIFLGDIIFDNRKYSDEKSYLTGLLGGFEPGKLRRIPGFFYLIQVSMKERQVRVFNTNTQASLTFHLRCHRSDR
jgi:hypothetical protein